MPPRNKRIGSTNSSTGAASSARNSSRTSTASSNRSSAASTLSNTSTSSPTKKPASKTKHTDPKDPVVASLKRSPHPYSSISLSPTREYAVTAFKDTLQILRISPSAGISPIKTIPSAQHFSDKSKPMNRIHEDVRDAFVTDTGSLFGQKTTSSSQSMINVVITDVSWSKMQEEDSKEDTSLIAAAGSNGVIVVWNASALLKGDGISVTAATPEAVLKQHQRHVNSLAWHPKRSGLLLSGSQDGTVLLWERKKAAKPAQANQEHRPLRMWLGGIASAAPAVQRYAWQYRSKFEPKSEAVRSIRWSQFFDDVFALVTSSGTLIAYNMNVPPRAVVKMTAHAGDATTLDWHPTMPFVVATGGANDRSVKIWDLEPYLTMSMGKDDSNMATNLNTLASTVSEASSDTAQSGSTPSTHVSFPTSSSFPGRSYSPSNNTLGNNLTTSSRHKSTSSNKAMLHMLAITASVTSLRWRPPSNDIVGGDDRHSSMMAIASVKGASAGGEGVLSLWSFHRPFMPLSVVHGHKEGAVTDFEWLQTPVNEPKTKTNATDSSKQRSRRPAVDSTSERNTNVSRVPGSSHESDVVLFDNSEGDDVVRPVEIWQHVLSVGRDGRCLIQSFVRGDRPIERVPPSSFAMANLSPFQKGYGSLQLFSVFQPVPSGQRSDFLLTGLRRDNVTNAAPGIFREKPLASDKQVQEDASLLGDSPLQSHLPASSPELFFNVVDQGDLDRDGKPADKPIRTITVSPEVVHLSRFASQYELYPNEKYPTRIALCLHNGDVAEDLKCPSLAHMWRMMSQMLESAGVDGLPYNGSETTNVMQFAILPTVKSLLIERAEDGDVQTCVALCEVLQVVQPDQTVRIPDLDINLVREWYLSYIDLLRDMCLFSSASYLIRNSNDPFIAALNQQSTTIHESCPSCGKPLFSTDSTTEADQGGPPRRLCKSCRKRVGLCFLCHEPVKGMYVWCPGCGHGGHLDHALQWFGGLTGKAVREVCPTGCGHKCNMLQQISAFPRTESLKDFSDQMFDMPPGL